MENTKVTFIDTPPHLLTPPSKLYPLQDLVPPSWGVDDNTLGNDYNSYDNLLQGVRDYTGVLDFTANISTNHENASGVSADPQVQGLFDQIRDLIRKDLLTPASHFPEAVSPAEPLPGAAEGPSSGGASPPSGGGASPETGGLFPAPVLAAARKGTAMRNNKIPRPNVVTRRAAAKPTGAFTHYRGVRPNNNNNNSN